MNLMKLDNLVEGTIVKRPSKLIKTPYVADILHSETNEEVLGHTASLGCCGLADNSAHILMAPCPPSKVKKDKDKLKCSHTVYLAIQKDEKQNETIIGIFPKLAEQLVENALQKNYLQKLKNIKSYRRETPVYIENYVDSRFDFSGLDENNIPFLMEVKNVPLADYEDIPAKERKKMDFSNRDFNSKVAYFPDGYRKKTTDTISPRALKHIKELTYIKATSITRCIMCYVIQRNDVNRFQVSIIDPEYRQAVKEALEKGVEIITLVVEWNRNGEALFITDELPITSFE
jgi:DNA-binding sugar fermentation-stimulating protein